MLIIKNVPEVDVAKNYIENIIVNLDVLIN